MPQPRNLPHPSTHPVCANRVSGLRRLSTLPRSSRYLGIAILGALCALIVGLGTACGAGGPQPGNVLHGLAPIESRSITNADRVTDGVTPRNGDAWRSDLSAEFRGGARLTYDLEASRPIDAILMIADNNDRFELAVSDDNVSWRPLWSVPSVPEPGMRERSVGGLGGSGRYLRITARGGDQFVSVGELLAFERTPATFPPQLARTASGSMYAGEQRILIGLGAVVSVAMLACLAAVPGWLSAIAVLVGFVAVFLTGQRLAPLWPFHEEISSWFRVVLAVMGAVGLAVARYRARTWAITALLSLVAVLSISTFYNFGRPWFWDFEHRRPTPVHTFDMRVYYPVAKYFDELKFDGLYFASVAAYVEGKPASMASVMDVELRDLRNNMMVRARDVQPEIENIHKRFSPERWAEFKKDMSYFWRSMAQDYLSTLRDHGGNATPAWLAIAHIMFAGTEASERVLTIAGALDPLLFFALCVCIWRSFGRYTALACMIVFGATDFPQLGSNWAGATLRFDWMTALGFAACAFRTGRPMLGGALLGYGAMMRAFPVLSLALLGGGVVVHLAWQAYRAKKLPSWAELRAEHRPLIRTVSGAVLVMAALFALSTSMFGFKDGWGTWSYKIKIHNEKSNTNHVGLRTALSFDPDLTIRKVSRMPHTDLWRIWHDGQRATYHKREPLFWLGVLAFVGASLFVCMRAPFERATALGLLLVPVLSYPANYYMHAVYILPLAASMLPALRTYLIELIVLAMCATQYWTLGITRPMGGDERFFWQSIILLSATALILTVLAYRKHTSQIPPAVEAGAQRPS